MLVLTRKQNEKIRIGDSIVITVVRMKGNAVRLGIEAPRDVNILRGELVFETATENVKAKTAKAKTRVNAAHPNPTSQWPEGRREEQSRPSWPTALMDTVL